MRPTPLGITDSDGGAFDSWDKLLECSILLRTWPQPVSAAIPGLYDTVPIFLRLEINVEENQ
jgi:hypothetical protein